MTANIIQISNDEPKNFFAPIKSDIFIYEENIKSLLNITNLKKLILEKEKEIVKQYPHTDDGDTSLGDSLTSRFLYYNLLDWSNTDEIKNVIKKTHDNFRQHLNLSEEKNIFVQCWANVMRKGQQIKRHSHYHNSYSYLGGHICIDTDNTSTHYISPFTKEIYSSNNEVGKITLFPNWIEHYTDVYNGDKERITIAFDIVDKIGYDKDIFDNKKHRWKGI